jgi:hypothetical protein
VTDDAVALFSIYATLVHVTSFIKIELAAKSETHPIKEAFRFRNEFKMYNMYNMYKTTIRQDARLAI